MVNEAKMREARDALRDTILKIWEACKIYSDALDADPPAAKKIRDMFPSIAAPLWPLMRKVGKGTGDIRVMMDRPDFHDAVVAGCKTDEAIVRRMLTNKEFLDSVLPPK